MRDTRQFPYLHLLCRDPAQEMAADLVGLGEVIVSLKAVKALTMNPQVELYWTNPNI
jgi:hypothetical protein